MARELNEAYAVGDTVFVWWMGAVVQATIWSRHPKNQYRVLIDGVKGHPFYGADEILTEGAEAASVSVSGPPP